MNGTNQKLFDFSRVSDSTGQLKVSKVATGNLKLSMLDSKDAFILDTIVDGVYVFVGRECTIDERSKACHWGQTYLKQQNLPLYTQVTRVLETAEPASFLQWLVRIYCKKCERNFGFMILKCPKLNFV